jgi:hypothetical protein
MTRSSVLAVAVVAAMGLGLRTASAGSVTFSGSSGDLAARVTFVSSGNTLTVTLTNTATIPTPNNGSLLENVFWNSNSLGTVGSTAYLSGVAIPAGSAPVAPATTASNFSMYGFGTGSGAPVLNEYGVGGTAWLLNFDKNHLQQLNGNSNPTTSPDGPNGGLASASTTSFTTANAIANALVFTIHTASELDVSTINDVVFTYGTGPEDFHSFPPTHSAPVPAAVWAGGSMLALLGVRRVMRKV